MRKKKNESIWHKLTAGIPATATKKKYYYEICPGLGFKAVSLGRTRDRWFSCKEVLVLYRNNLNPQNSYCYIDWISENQLIERP
jgi:hypothetical protein